MSLDRRCPTCVSHLAKAGSVPHCDGPVCPWVRCATCSTVVDLRSKSHIPPRPTNPKDPA